eukprot:400807_1
MATFVDADAAKNFECVICFDMFKEPVQIGCNDHIFCRRCITSMIHPESNTIKCPLCRVRCKASSIRGVKFVQRQMNQLLVKCPNHVISPKKAEYLTAKCKSKTKENSTDTAVTVPRRSARLQKKKQAENTNNTICGHGKKRKRSDDTCTNTNSNKKQKRSFDPRDTCDWTGDFQSFKSHDCPLELISCHFCSTSMLRRDLKQHQ